MAQLEGGIGFAVPSVFVAASPAGDWVSLCQANEDTNGDGKLTVELGAHGDVTGDRLSMRFVERGGSGFPIDAFLGSDQSGRFVAFSRQGRVVLRDVHQETETDLSQFGADPRDDSAPYRPHRALHFHPRQELLLYLRQHGSHTWVVERNLLTGEETPIDPGTGLLWRAEYEPDGDFARFSVITRDSNGNRRLDWSFPPKRSLDGDCPGPVPRFFVPSPPGDDALVRLVRLSDGKLLTPEGLVMTVGNAILTRNEDLELWLEFPGERRLVSSALCAGRVLHADAKTGSVLVGCGQQFGQRRTLLLRTAERRINLRLDVAPFEVDGRFPHAPELLLLNPRNEAVLLDVATGDTVKLEDRTRLLASHQQRVLVELNDKLALVDAKGEVQPLNVARPAYSRVRQVEGFVTVGRLWLDLTGGGKPLTLRDEPLALSRTGSVLLGKSRQGAVPRGPFRWFVPGGVAQPP